MLWALIFSSLAVGIICYICGFRAGTAYVAAELQGVLDRNASKKAVKKND